MLSRDEILKTEYSEEFDKLRKDAMYESYFKYGPLERNYKIDKCLNAEEALKASMLKFEKTRNLDHLVSVANFAMILYKCRKPGDVYEHTATGERSVSGLSVQEIADMSVGKNI